MFPAKTSTTSDESHPGSRGGAEWSGVNLKQRYPNELADPLGMEQLELKKGVARIQDHVLGLWDAQRDWIRLLRCEKGR